MKGEQNVKKSNTRKSCKSSLQKKNNHNKNQERISCRFTDKNSCSYGDQADSESDDLERFSNFVDSELISDSIHDDSIPNVIWNLQNQTNGRVETHRDVFSRRRCSAKNYYVMLLRTCVLHFQLLFQGFIPLAQNTSEWMLLCISKYYWLNVQVKTQVSSWLKPNFCLSQRVYTTNLQNSQVQAILFDLLTTCPFLPFIYPHLSADYLEFVR